MSGRWKKVLCDWWPVLLLLLCLMLIFLARLSPALTEQIYARGIYPLIAHSYGAITSLLPLSIAELTIEAAILAVVGLLVFGVASLWRWRKGKPVSTKVWKAAPAFLLKAGCLLCSMFILFCGFNYYRPEYATLSGLSVRESDTEELAALCAELIQRANELAPLLPRDETGAMILSTDIWSLCRQSREVFGELAAENPLLPDFPITPKPVLASHAMSMAQITGVFCPITFEANLNHDAPAYLIPATACHELAHTRGFMREDEANFLGYLAASKSDDPVFAYSGVMMALLHVQNRLYSADYEKFRTGWEQSAEPVRRDFAYNNEYWARYEGVVAQVSTTVNNSYLQLNNQSDGVQSYGRMVDLLLADYRQRHGIS